MIRQLLRVIFEHPLLTTVFIVDLFLIFLIIAYVFMRVFGEKRPDRKLLSFIQKFRIKLKEHSLDSIEGLYYLVIDTYIKKGVLSHDDGRGFRAREKVLAALEGEERKTVETIFRYFEAKKYGGILKNEREAVGYLAHKFRSL